MSEPLQYLTNDRGERVGVLLDWNTYSRLVNQSGLDEEYLVGLSVDELEALASCKLALTEQSHLDDIRAIVRLLSILKIVNLSPYFTLSSKFGSNILSGVKVKRR